MLKKQGGATQRIKHVCETQKKFVVVEMSVNVTWCRWQPQSRFELGDVSSFTW